MTPRASKLIHAAWMANEALEDIMCTLREDTTCGGHPSVSEDDVEILWATYDDNTPLDECVTTYLPHNTCNMSMHAE